MTKICSSCGEDKPLSEFYIRKDVKIGYAGKCKVCTVKTATIWWHKEGKKVKSKDFVPRENEGAECESCCRGGLELREMKITNRIAMVCAECEHKFGWPYRKTAV